MKKNPREAAYLALCSTDFISDSLQEWKRESSPTQQDFNLAYEIAAGSTKMAKALDYIASELSTNKKLKLKRKEKTLLRSALYQVYFMDRLPLYAITNESQEIAKKYCHPSFVKFLNAILRKEEKVTLPEEDLAVYYSYPESLVADFIKQFGREKTIEILEIGNQSPKTTARRRPSCEMITLEAGEIQTIKDDPNYYIQNSTPVRLMETLAKQMKRAPDSILDLCAAPGGKTLLAHDLFPEAKLFANDVSEKRSSRLKENLSKYGLDVEVSCQDGACFVSDQKFDLVIIDAPCGNSGVLNKRPEARWRGNNELVTLQNKLIEHALTLLNNAGVIWYLTCSILEKENHGKGVLILPKTETTDGGFGAILTLNHA